MSLSSKDFADARAAFFAGALRCAPVALGALAYGLVFGALAQQAGLSFGETAFMSAVVYSGFVLVFVVSAAGLRKVLSTAWTALLDRL